jgi:hypothetical protein
MPDVTVVEFGSRAGSYTALALFGTLFAAIAFGVLREIRRRAPRRRRTARLVAALLLAGPLTLAHATSLSGFYEAEARDGRLVLHYLHPLTTEIAIRDAAARPPCARVQTAVGTSNTSPTRAVSFTRARLRVER